MQWSELKILAARREIVPVVVTGFHETGDAIVVDVAYGEATGFIPASRMALPPDHDVELLLTDLIGQEIDAVIAGLDDGVFAADRLSAMQRIRGRTPLSPETVVRARIRHVLPNVLYAEAAGRLIRVEHDAAVRRRTPTLRLVYAPGDEKDVRIEKVVSPPAEDAPEIYAGNIIAVAENPYAKAMYRPGARLRATVLRVFDRSISLSFEPEVIGFAHLPRYPVAPGDEVIVKIDSVNPDEMKIFATIIRRVGARMPGKAVIRRRGRY
ncbi:MAG: hypothetical protein HSCHL_1632 [Hydrogenibacillus schlegelii]|uniref:S1 motif domain-containing protein n=1 Tax=Hydrogenibacillus schlegelii TaxID=1484 RepID=A0A2T5G4D2_HYDSH|nr:hypothetical protein [Hydrogenibacillus schlegelii]PTQ51042.1 MAG: hypothetical protein HSCHL_1632 [Hydrogenibacillus schlegelii]